MAEYEISSLPIDLTAQIDPIKPGARWGFSWQHYNSNEVLANTTGWTVACQFRENPESADSLLSLSVGSGITNDNAGTFTLELTPTQTAGLKVKEVYFDIYVTSTVVECPFQAQVPVLYRVTR